MNGVSTQIDFVCTRRSTADSTAKAARVLSLDLVPWRCNAKHKPVQASIPLIAGWKHNALRRVQKPRRRYDAEALEASARTNDTTYQALCSKVEGFLSEAPPDMPLFTINRTVLTFCETAYPLRPVTRAPRPWMTPGVINSLSRMWELHRALKAFGRGRDPSAQACLHAWRYAVAFDRQVKQFRREGKQRRRQVLLDQLSQAQQAANSFSQGKLYRVIRQMAPKTKREKVQIRSETGALMTVKEEFREIAGHCRQVFGQGAPKQRRALPAPLVLEVEEVKLAITQLQARKGVPRSSFPATIWKACAGSLAERLCRVANSHWGQCDLWVPGEWADCELLMIPKPGKEEFNSVLTFLKLLTFSRGREVLDLGLPGKPLLLPKVQQMTNMAMEDVASVAQQEMLDIFPASAGHSKQGRREEDKETEQPAKFSKQREKGGQGKGQWNRSWGSGSWGDWSKNKDQQSSETTEEVAELVKLLAKVVLKLEDDSARLRAESGFILYFDTGAHGILPMLLEASQNWKAKKEEGKVTTSLRVVLLLCALQELQTRLQNVLVDENVRAAVIKHGWLKDGEVALDPVWTFMKWDPASQTQVESGETPMKHSKLLDHVDRLRRAFPQEHVLTRFHSTRPMSDTYQSPVLPFLMSLGFRSAAADTAYDAWSDLIGCSALRMIGLRHRKERLDRQPLAKVLTTTFQNSSICDWRKREEITRKPQAARGSEEDKDL
ncbi:hypothetical protein AK812_SmicGene37684 [Symbiodinium microadriaticum]|uniref:Uncharacterized protein n=1 Tax=Symbiodinium microadriaticum TaxID=2951 RepID=A0A1Q9CFP1_SYMMI|nr:hypothetical protein AK812_SmicGene37684 [Symbiodinium microadriaticum]